MARKLPLGEYCGATVSRRRVHGFLLTENLFQGDHAIPVHAHEYPHFTLVLAGGFTEQYGGLTLNCGAQSLLLVPAGEPHTDTVWSPGAHSLSVELSRGLVKRLAEQGWQFREPRTMTSPGLRRAACRLYSEFRSADPVSDVAIESIALDVLVSAARTGTETDGGKWLPRVKEILQEQYAQRLPLREIADAVGVHETHLAKAFRHRYGCTVGDYVRDLRLEQARNDLERTKDSLAEIALRHGFCDQAHFSRSFRLAYGTTPSAYRSRR